MNHRERFYAVCRHEKADRAVFDLAGSPQTNVDSERVRKEMAAALGIPPPFDETYRLDERILRALDIDTRRIGGMPTPPTSHVRQEGNVYYDEFGVGRKLAGGHFEICDCPLAGKSIEEVEAYELPDPAKIDGALIDKWAAQAEFLHNETDYAVVAEHPVLGVFEIGCWMFGFDDYLCRLLLEPETVKLFSDRILEYQKAVIKKYYGALGAYIDVTTSGDDFGTQRAPFMAKETFDELIAPYLKERITYTKKFTAAFFKHHTCGSVFGLIPSLIDCGVEILNPIQPNAWQMEPDRLKAAYGDKIAFWGGIDTQNLLNYADKSEVRREVQRVLGILDQSGGYILAPAHTIQEDVKTENLLEIYRAAKEYYGG